MRSRLTSLALAAFLTAFVGGSTLAAERFEDAAGDATGDSPDLLAVTVEEIADGPLLRFSLELGEERPFSSDMETWTDVIVVIMSSEPTVDMRGFITSETSYVTGTHAVGLEEQEGTGAMLLTPDGLLENVVDVAADGDVLAFTLDRELLDDPPGLYFQILLGVERDAEAEEEEGDIFPELDQPPAFAELGGAED